MARGRGGKHGRGGAARGGRGGARGGGRGGGGSGPNDRVAHPKISELPTSLLVSPSSSPIPSALIEAFPEFTRAQPYFSALERLNPEFGGSPTAYKNCWLGLSGEVLAGVERKDDPSSFNATLKLSDGSAKDVFVKRIHLLDPISSIQGEYIWPDEGSLPAPSDLWRHALAKINDPLNEAYVDALFALTASRLVETGVSPHWCRCYGTYTARVAKYLYNITDEYSSLRVKPWWRRNMRLGLFSLYKENDEDDATATPTNTFMTTGLNDISADDFVALDDDTEAKSKGDTSIEDDGMDIEPEVHGDGGMKLSAPRLRLKRLSRSVSSSDSDSSEDSEDEDEQFVEFTNFPVQVTLLERAEGTLDELLDEEEEEIPALEGTKEERWAAWLFQVIAALTTAQYYFGFVHNDLHTNNIMWSKTDAPFIYYRVQKSGGGGGAPWFMKVPTFGRIMKIIDFGRASYHLPDPAGFFISDAFFPGNDAATQYNCEPFYDPDEGKKVEPNTSFDLCRLSVSLLETLYPDRPAAAAPTKIMSREGAKMYTETVSGVYNMLWEWLIDDEGKNVLRRPDGEERYPDFDLYRALAADVHRAVPAKQIERALFNSYRCSTVPSGEKVYDLHI